MATEKKKTTEKKTAEKKTVAGKEIKSRTADAKAAPKAAPKAHGPVFLKKIEKSLQEYKSEIMNNLIANSKDFKEIVEGLDPKDLADIASDDIDRKMIEALGSQELKRLRNIDSALSRIKEGKYGFCIKCGKLIPQDRLEAIPYALMCIECKSEEERRTR